VTHLVKGLMHNISTARGDKKISMMGRLRGIFSSIIRTARQRNRKVAGNGTVLWGKPEICPEDRCTTITCDGQMAVRRRVGRGRWDIKVCQIAGWRLYKQQGYRWGFYAGGWPSRYTIERRYGSVPGHEREYTKKNRRGV